MHIMAPPKAIVFQLNKVYLLISHAAQTYEQTYPHASTIDSRLSRFRLMSIYYLDVGPSMIS
jgi:hypothetical protein